MKRSFNNGLLAAEDGRVISSAEAAERDVVTKAALVASGEAKQGKTHRTAWPWANWYVKHKLCAAPGLFPRMRSQLWYRDGDDAWQPARPELAEDFAGAVQILIVSS